MEDKSELMPMDIIILEELVNEKLKATTNEIAIMNFTRILQRLSWEYNLADKREQVSLFNTIAEHNKKRGLP